MNDAEKRELKLVMANERMRMAIHEMDLRFRRQVADEMDAWDASVEKGDVDEMREQKGRMMVAINDEYYIRKIARELLETTCSDI